MKIKYEIALEDFFVFSNYLIKTSPLMQKTIRKGQMWWACGPLAGGFIYSIIKGYPPEKTLLMLATLSIAISVPMFFMYTHYFKHRNRKSIKKLHANGSYNGVLGVHEMTISDGHLADKTEDSDVKVQWSSIKRIETIADHTFIFTDDISAYIIPHNKITGSDVSQFINKLNAVFKKSPG